MYSPRVTTSTRRPSSRAMPAGRQSASTVPCFPSSSDERGSLPGVAACIAWRDQRCSGSHSTVTPT
jgi:hypothetical protein